MTGKRALSDEQEIELCRRWIAGESHAELAKAFGIGRVTSPRILKRRGITREMRITEPKGAGTSATSRPRPEYVEQYAQIGEPPVGDALEIAGWLQKALAISAQQVLTDPECNSEQARRKELREIARAIVQTTPQTLIGDALRMIREDARLLEEGAGPEMEPAPTKRKRARRAKTS